MTSQSPVKNGSGQMFDRIAGRYDFLNRVISLGQDQSWRRKLVNSLGLTGKGEAQSVLDVATGTADVAQMIHRMFPEVKVVGLDPSRNMLDIGVEKVKTAKQDQHIELVVGDAQEMDFEDGRFDACCISFGIRNVPDRVKGLKEMNRVTRPGGKVSVLELSEPRRGIMSGPARFFIHNVVPLLGSWLSGDKEYRYLQKSIEAFPAPEEFKAMMEEAGLKDVTIKSLNFGSVILFVGTAT